MKDFLFLCLRVCLRLCLRRPGLHVCVLCSCFCLCLCRTCKPSFRKSKLTCKAAKFIRVLVQSFYTRGGEGEKLEGRVVRAASIWILLPVVYNCITKILWFHAYKITWETKQNTNTFTMSLNQQMSPLVHPILPPLERDVWDWTWKIPYWWRSSTEICVLSLIGCYLRAKIQNRATANQRKL